LAAKHFKHEETLQEFTKKTLDYIGENANKNKPFFVYFPLSAPHTPILPSKEFKGKSGLNDYGDFVLMVDDVVKQVVNKLKKEGVYDNTIIVFTSDNGCSPSADYATLLAKGHNPSWQYRGTKSDIYDGGHRVPFIVSWPKQTQMGKSSNQLMCTTDFFATISELLQVKQPDNTAEDSFSFLKDLKPVKTSTPKREDIINHSIFGELAISKGDWKLVMGQSSGGWSAPSPKDSTTLNLPKIQLFNIKTDIKEANNVYKEHPEIVNRLVNLLTQEIKNGRSTPGAIQKNTAPTYWPEISWMKP
jgi:arylsulfatase A